MSYPIQIYTMTNCIGGMYTVFRIYQEVKEKAVGYCVTYVYPSKEKYIEKKRGSGKINIK